MKKLILMFLCLFCLSLCCFAKSVFENKTSAVNVINQLPRLKSVNCKFSQAKNVQNLSAIKSSGNFKFIENKGVIFETIIPEKSIADYTSEQNKKINSIILSISNGNYAFLDNNFNIYFLEGKSWTLALSPKTNTPASKYMNFIIINGNQKNIEHITLNTKNKIQTDIFFECPD